ncbi:zf-HC2 domain-containing protein [Amycolatopsis sp. PS_44_ISF1]|uniref:zf-HC2 domain-containing protein n=1 Tax=Amycolatopsis sp. PS_44_ISF1 TaxID=2974917 RepID=UPI0028DE5868|nr:zf-HC2 domain-containing protein [Amycolatopsis sp. PS_44_ISF1]MDT8911376.1 zf-HC2 domain-containing protein [Amycolatopsis sp. PS_44_ISF1]
MNHVADRLLTGYAGGQNLPADQAWAVEAHLELCAACRARLATLSTPDVSALVEGVWSGLEPGLASRPQPVAARFRVALSRWTTPVMLPWLLMVLLVSGFSVWLDATVVRTGSFVQLFAPVLPVLGVAASWSGGLDPAYELVTASARAGLDLVLRRTTAVLVAVLPVLLIAGGLTGSAVGLWLLPSLAFTTGTLAIGLLIGVERAAGALVVVWLAVFAVPTVVTGSSFALQKGAVAVWAGIFALTVVVVVLRRSAFTRLIARR